MLNTLLAELKKELEGSIAASRDAADYATNEEARAESQWDTQGLEASYLAASQASQARQWAEAIDMLNGLRDTLLLQKEEIGAGALVGCDFDGVREYFFLVPAGGGQTLSVEGQEVTSITYQSPVATALIGKRAGTAFKLPNGAPGSIVSVE